MRDHHVGALLVVGENAAENDETLGIVTDRDLVVRGMASGVGPADCTVSHVMSDVVISVAADADIAEAIALMRLHGLRRLVVTERDGTLAGMLSLDDVLSTLTTDLGRLDPLLQRQLQREISKVGV